MNRSRWVLILVTTTLLATLALASPASASTVQPVFVSGNPTCTSLDPDPGVKELKVVQPVVTGQYSDGTLTVNITTIANNGINWTSNIPVDEVMVKSKGGNVYNYGQAGSTGDNGLYAPGQKVISHVLFCYDNVSPPPPPPTLTVTKAGSGTGTVTSTDGGINCGSDCSQSYNKDQQVTLQAFADTGSVFSGWSACGGTGDCQVTMNSSQTVTATFTQTYTLTVSKAGTGKGTVTSTDNPASINCGTVCSATYTKDTVVTLTAAPDTTTTPPSGFTGWSGAGCSGTSTCQVKMDGNKSVTATFDKSYGGCSNGSTTCDTYFVNRADGGKSRLLNAVGPDPGTGGIPFEFQVENQKNTSMTAVDGNFFNTVGDASCSSSAACIAREHTQHPIIAIVDLGHMAPNYDAEHGRYVVTVIFREDLPVVAIPFKETEGQKLNDPSDNQFFPIAPCTNGGTPNFQTGQDTDDCFTQSGNNGNTYTVYKKSEDLKLPFGR